MIRTKWHLTLLVVLLATLSSAYAWSSPLRVAMYIDDGVGSGWTNVAAALDDPARFVVTPVMGADIRAGILANFDVLVHPGGSGSAQGASLEEAGRDSVRAFVRRGGGYLGICAGSYLASSDYAWSLYLLNAKVIDKAHWNRGDGPVNVRFSGFGRDLFSLPQDTVVIEYRQGALMAPAQIDSLPAYVEAGAFASEIALNGAPTGVMIGTTAFAFSVYHQGRAVAFSPHPEVTAGYEYMVADAVEWVASSTPFLAVSMPRELEAWKAGSSHNIEWITESGNEPVAIEFSPDNGASWQPVVSGVTARYNWTVPATESANCLLRVTALADGALTHTVPFSITPPTPAIQSARGGNWSDWGTWTGGMVPGATDNVVIGSGHTVIVDVASSCLDISFQDANGRLGLTGDLSVYGSFSVYNTTVNPFYSGSSLWGASARMIFTGSADVQTINNLGTTSVSPYPCRFQQIVIDKPTGKFTTNPVTGLESNYKLGIGVSVEIVSGTFELGRSDDIEGRTVAGTATTPTITVQAGGIFRMLGSSSNIRRGNFIGDDTQKLGKMTVFGEAYLASTSTSRINFGGIDVESGGLLQVPYYSAGGSMGAGCFNPGTLTVKAGGTFINSLNTNYWFTNVTTPNQLSLLAGGTIEANSSAPFFPPLTVNEGTFLYSRSSSDQTVFDMDYKNLELRNSTEGARKLWALGANRVIAGELNNGYSAQTVIAAAEARTLTIQGTLRLTSGGIDNSDPEVMLTMGDGATIRRLVGTVSTAPAFAGMVDLIYASTSTNVTTGPELPAGTGVLRDLTLTGDEGLTLGAHVTVNGVCSLPGSDLTTGSYVLTLGPAASLVESAGKTVIGTARATRTASQSVNQAFGGIGLELNAAGGAPGVTTVTRVTGTALDINGTAGIQRYFDVSPANNAGLGATVVLHYDESELNGIDENLLSAYMRIGGVWTVLPASLDPTNNAVTVAGIDEFGTLTLGHDGVVATLLQAFACAPTPAGIEVSWTLSEAVRTDGFRVSRAKGADGAFQPIEVGIVETGALSYRFVDAGCEAGVSYRYRVDLTGEGGGMTLFLTSAAATPALKLQLSQNYPNPFKPTTLIEYSLPAKTHVVLDIFDLGGRRVARLVDGEQDAGSHTRGWSGTNDAGTQAAGGVYFSRLSVGKETITRKMVLLK